MNTGKKKIRLTQVRSTIGLPKVQKSTLYALGLRKVNQQVEHNISPQILGMVNKIAHLLKMEKIWDDEVK